ncbi:MAG: metal-dependent hydrolase [Desulfobacterales bacterium]|nr:metal-dependent hydrolase [Desulfobacterales bacterium]MBF0397799.1 metal-dependent hydrolase [Desulfobacterales bacterium]
MSPITHLLISWRFAEITSQNERNCAFVTWAGVLPDIDGLGVIIDMLYNFFGYNSPMFYHRFHHIVLHGLFGSIIIPFFFTIRAKDKLKFFLTAFLCVHIHLICDIVGSRGPTELDIWPIYYLEPFSEQLKLSWSGQWELNSWQNILITSFILGGVFVKTIRNGHSIVSIFNKEADAIFVKVVQQRWYELMKFFVK